MLITGLSLLLSLDNNLESGLYPSSGCFLGDLCSSYWQRESIHPVPRPNPRAMPSGKT